MSRFLRFEDPAQTVEILQGQLLTTRKMGEQRLHRAVKAAFQERLALHPQTVFLAHQRTIMKAALVSARSEGAFADEAGQEGFDST